MNIVINGATSGIGKALAERLSQENCKLSICGQSSDKLKKLITKPNLSKNVVYSEAFCVRDIGAIDKFVDGSHSVMGKIDVVINCVGVNRDKALIENLSFEELDTMYQINFRAPARFAQRALQLMGGSKAGKIVNISTTSCLFASEKNAGYTSTKAGFDAYCRVLRKEASLHGIDVVTIYPGGTNTNFRENFVDGYMDAKGVANAIFSVIFFAENVVPHELVIRPRLERNY